MLPQHHTMARLVSLANVSKMVRTLPYRAVMPTSKASAQEHQGFTRTTGFFQSNVNIAKTEPLAARYSLSNAFAPRRQRDFAFFSAKYSTASASQAFQRQTLREFSNQRIGLLPRNPVTKFSYTQTIQRQQQRAYSRYSGSNRRPFRFIFKTMIISSMLVALPAIIIFGAPVASFVFIPLAIGGVIGGIFLLTGGILFFIFPIVALGSVLTFWFYAMPVAATARELNKILKRAKKQAASSTPLGLTPALEAIGPDWEIQKSKSDEWFRWEFPRSVRDLDRISIRMAVFDPNDDSDRKRTTSKWLDNVDYEDNEYEKDTIISSDRKKSRHDAANSRLRNNFDQFAIDNLVVKRENDHILIQIEDDGAKLLSQKWGKKYLELAKLVDRAATEMETIEPELDLGNQIVLVRKNSHDSFWNKFSLCGNIAPRIPFDRTWVHDVIDE
ncbi:hypothetical protein BGX27_007964 [Mortierella sp. AM989]|nr:hypothetical protein BGX27_007964 [Mortierella sp. AM989]